MSSESDPDSVPVPNSVQVYENLGEWFVLVVRDGKDYVTTFELESYARAYAEGQRLGLGLRQAGDVLHPRSSQNRP